MRFAESSCLTSSCFTVHGFVHTVGSSIVTAYSRVFASSRVHRAVRCRFSRAPTPAMPRGKLLFGEKFVTSTTSVLPSHLPRESPHHWRTFDGRCGLPFITMLRCQPCPWLVS